jgi:hypothetical protein
MGQTAYDMARRTLQQPQNQLQPPLGDPLQPPPRRSWVGATLRFLGWLFVAVIGIGGIVIVLSLWLVSDAARDILSRDTNVTISGDAVVESIRRVNKQVFVEHYNTVDLDYQETPEGWLGYLPIRQSFVLLLKGRVPAGFDLRELRPEDVWVSRDGQRVQVVLPPPVIFEENVNVDFERSRILVQSDTCPDFVCQDTLGALKDQVLPQGRQLLIEASLQSGIMVQAAEAGQLYYEQFLTSLGFREVRVLIRSAAADD